MSQVQLPNNDSADNNSTKAPSLIRAAYEAAKICTKGTAIVAKTIIGNAIDGTVRSAGAVLEDPLLKKVAIPAFVYGTLINSPTILATVVAAVALPVTALAALGGAGNAFLGFFDGKDEAAKKGYSFHDAYAQIAQSQPFAARTARKAANNQTNNLG